MMHTPIKHATYTTIPNVLSDSPTTALSTRSNTMARWMLLRDKTEDDTYTIPPKKKSQKQPSKTPKKQLICHIAQDATTILAVQKFRAKIFSEAYGVAFDGGIDKDPYDIYSIHVLVQDTCSKEIVACTRIITPEAKLKLGKYYSEYEFDLNDYLHGKTDVYEIGRTCVDTKYRGGQALSILWQGMLPLVLNQLRAKYLIGCVSINLGTSPEKLMAAQTYMTKKAKQKNIPSKQPFQLHTDTKLSSNMVYKGKHVPSLVKKYRKLGAVFSADGFHDVSFHCVDYFVGLKINKQLIVKVKLLCALLDFKNNTHGRYAAH